MKKENGEPIHSTAYNVAVQRSTIVVRYVNGNRMDLCHCNLIQLQHESINCSFQAETTATTTTESVGNLLEYNLLSNGRHRRRTLNDTKLSQVICRVVNYKSQFCQFC